MLRNLVKKWLFGNEKPTVVQIEKSTLVEKHIHHHHYADGRTTTRQDGANIPGSPFIQDLKGENKFFD